MEKGEWGFKYLSIYAIYALCAECATAPHVKHIRMPFKDLIGKFSKALYVGQKRLDIVSNCESHFSPHQVDSYVLGMLLDEKGKYLEEVFVDDHEHPLQW